MTGFGAKGSDVGWVWPAALGLGGALCGNDTVSVGLPEIVSGLVAVVAARVAAFLSGKTSARGFDSGTSLPADERLAASGVGVNRGVGCGVLLCGAARPGNAVGAGVGRAVGFATVPPRKTLPGWPALVGVSSGLEVTVWLRRSGGVPMDCRTPS